MEWSLGQVKGPFQDLKWPSKVGPDPVTEGWEAGELNARLLPSTRGRWKPRITHLGSEVEVGASSGKRPSEWPSHPSGRCTDTESTPLPHMDIISVFPKGVSRDHYPFKRGSLGKRI